VDGLVQPIDLEALEEVVETIRARDLGVLEIVNLNSPRQHVLSGAQARSRRRSSCSRTSYYVVPTIIERQVPMHSSLFTGVGEAMLPHLRRAGFRVAAPALPAEPPGRPAGSSASHADYVRMLAEHVHTPVLWRRSIDHVIEHHPDAVFVEVGPRQVLFNLLDRKWVARPKHATDSRDDLAQQFAGVVAALRPAMANIHAPRPAGADEVREWPRRDDHEQLRRLLRSREDVPRLVKTHRKRPVFVAGDRTSVQVAWGRAELERMLPHRDPFLLIDTIDAVDLSSGGIAGWLAGRSRGPGAARATSPATRCTRACCWSRRSASSASACSTCSPAAPPSSTRATAAAAAPIKSPPRAVPGGGAAG
jgi:hypothetical protein